MLLKTNKKLSAFDWILIGMILYSIGNIFYNTNRTICYVLSAIAFLVIVLSLLSKVKYYVPFNGYFRVVFFLYIFWNFIVLLRGVSDGFDIHIYSPLIATGWLGYILPLILLLGFKELSLKTVFKFSFVYALIGIVLTIVFIKQIVLANLQLNLFNMEDGYADLVGIVEIPDKFLSPLAFMLLCFHFVSKKYNVISIFAVMLNFIMFLLAARRGGAFFVLLMIFFTIYIYIFNFRKGSKALKILFLSIIIASCVYLFIAFSDTLFSMLSLRIDEDTRSGVEDYFYKSFEGQTLDWIIGRGIGGTYYCPIFYGFNFRDNIETGYLHIILKGGIISLVLYVFILLNSAYKGFYKSRNILTKGMAFYLVAYVIYLYPWGLPSFNFQYVILWICVLYCQSKNWRMKTTNQIQLELK